MQVCNQQPIFTFEQWEIKRIHHTCIMRTNRTMNIILSYGLKSNRSNLL